MRTHQGNPNFKPKLSVYPEWKNQESTVRKKWLIRSFLLHNNHRTSLNLEYNTPITPTESIVTHTLINNIRRINKFLIKLNNNLPINGEVFLSFEDLEHRHKRMRKTGKILFPLLILYDYIINRVIPKLPLLRTLYFIITKGHNRAISHAEMFGRLYACGFEVIKEEKLEDSTCVWVKKRKQPLTDNKPTYGPLISLKRIGKGGKTLNIYKVRTMHPFSEYLQEYVYEKNKLQDGGKIKNDFRITNLGRSMRKYWIDELPSLYNLLKGDLKIVGVRPLSKHYFSLYSKELQQERVNAKPGLIPPFYVDLPKTMDEIMQSELVYIRKHKKAPLRTDVTYFFKAAYNIFIKKARSA